MIKSQPSLDPEAALRALRNIDATARRALGHKNLDRAAILEHFETIRRYCAEAGLADQGITRTVIIEEGQGAPHGLWDAVARMTEGPNVISILAPTDPQPKENTDAAAPSTRS